MSAPSSVWFVESRLNFWLETRTFVGLSKAAGLLVTLELRLLSQASAPL